MCHLAASNIVYLRLYSFNFNLTRPIMGLFTQYASYYVRKQKSAKIPIYILFWILSKRAKCIIWDYLVAAEGSLIMYALVKTTGWRWLRASYSRVKTTQKELPISTLPWKFFLNKSRPFFIDSIKHIMYLFLWLPYTKISWSAINTQKTLAK